MSSAASAKPAMKLFVDEKAVKEPKRFVFEFENGAERDKASKLIAGLLKKQGGSTDGARGNAYIRNYIVSTLLFNQQLIITLA